MCCFSREIDSVHNTRIFARSHPDGRQFIIYSMSISAKEDIAMVLPIPVVPGSGEKAVQFIALDAYPTIFDDMAKGFPAIEERSPGADMVQRAVPAAKLEVQRVGSYDASFVPTVADFSRLDERFRLPEGTWEKIPGYKDFGFAVFKLRKGTHSVHPMAFSFLSATPDSIFFPTLHIHDGKVHEKAEFDHTFYCQATGLRIGAWQESPRTTSQFMNTDKTHGIVLGDHHLYKRTLSGMLNNTDRIAKAKPVV